MCFNICGFGAMNVFWLFFGVLFLTMQSLSLDCDTGMETFAGMAYHCSSLEYFFNFQWVLTSIYSLVIGVVLAVLPKMISNYDESANKAVMMVYSILYLLFTGASMATLYFVEVKAGDVTIDFMSNIPVLVVFLAPTPFLLLAMCLHKAKTPAALVKPAPIGGAGGGARSGSMRRMGRELR